MEFTGRVALITGGGGGIGRASALGFARRGAKVVVVDLDPTEGEASAELVRQHGGDARFVRADVTKSGDVQNYVKVTLDTYGAIDCFFNNAGIEGKVAPTQEYDEAVFDAVISVNLKGVFLGMRYVLPVMLKQGRGAVVNTASVAGLFGGPGMACSDGGTERCHGRAEAAAPGERDPSAGAGHPEEGHRFFRPGGKSMRFALIDAAKAEFPVHRLCGVLGVSQSGYSPGRTGRPAAATATTWCCWPMSARTLPGRTAPMAVRG